MAAVGAPLFGRQLKASLSGSALRLCSRDLFLMLGACDREASIAGASVTRATQDGRDAVVRLSSGVSIDLQQVAGEWLVQDIAGVPTHTGHLTQGPCAGA